MKLRWLSVILAVVVLLAPIQAENHNTYPLPEERGTAGILDSLEGLPVYVRVLQTTAHPDDESAGTLTWLSRKAHARVALFAITRGEGVQNILGSEKGDALGLLRTGELLEACRYYGIGLFFSTAIDFGFSKSAEETFSKWGHEATLEEMVRFIRMWKPTIIISRFQGNSSDGHGNHEAAGVISREAFRAAGDPHKFPEQFKLGLQAWQAKKLYTGAGRGGGDSSVGTAAGIVRVPVGDFDPVLGRSYREIGTEGYSKHRSQGNGAGYTLPGRTYDNFRLADSTIGGKSGDGSLFDSIDTSLLAIAELAGEESATRSRLRQDLEAAKKAGLEALQQFQPLHPATSADAALRGAEILADSLRRVEASPLSDAAKKAVVDALREKILDFQNAVTATLGIYLVAQSQDFTAVPGDKEAVTVHFFNRGTQDIDLAHTALNAAEGWIAAPQGDQPSGRIPAGGSATARFSVSIPRAARVTEPFWHRQNREDARYTTRPTPNVFAPFEDPAITARVTYLIHDAEVQIIEPVRSQAGDSLRGSDFVDLQVVPALSVKIAPEMGIAPLSADAQARQFQVSVLNNRKEGIQGSYKLVAPAGWQVGPSEVKLALSRKGETATTTFTVQIPAKTSIGSYPIEAVAAAAGQDYRRGYDRISYPENWTRNIFAPSRSVLEVFDVRLAPNLTIGYVMGSGDDVPESLEQLGVKVEMIGAADLAHGDLSRFSAIVTGVRAYNVNGDLQANNRRLLRYVEQGGTLIVQYNRLLSRGAEAPFPYGPYPMSNSDADRITVEDSPIRILDPQNPVFNVPNKITEADFQGWVQERGAYFMHSWDPRYTPLLSGHDPGEGPLEGGMLMTKLGNGYYIYTAYAWFRQLPAGVPGAYRLFANLLSLGKRPQ